jgi:DNA-binding IclR family transcriptional regulator
MEAGERQNRRGIQSIEVGYALLEVLAASHGMMSLRDIAAAAQMPPSKAHLYLASYLRVGLVIQESVTARYSLGPAAIRLGVAAIEQTDLLDAARSPVAALVERTGASASLSVWANRGPTIIYRRDGELPVPLSIRLGVVLPVLSSATGRVFMAHLPQAQWKRLVEQEGEPGVSLEEMGTLIRRRGFALTDSILNAGFFGVSSPIFDGSGKIAAAITALGLSAAADLDEDGLIATAVREEAAAVSRTLGWSEGR